MGPALVGNTGSSHKFKYGPLGHTVNLASRVEGATKQLGIPVLITGSTRAQLGDAFATRRLCRVRVVGINEPVDLYELHAEHASSDWLARRESYEAALSQFEAGDWRACCQTAYPLLGNPDGGYDVPTLNLMTRADSCLRFPPKSFDPAVELPSK
jgi:adenylate cyclase